MVKSNKLKSSDCVPRKSSQNSKRTIVLDTQLDDCYEGGALCSTTKSCLEKKKEQQNQLIRHLGLQWMDDGDYAVIEHLTDYDSVCRTTTTFEQKMQKRKCFLSRFQRIFNLKIKCTEGKKQQLKIKMTDLQHQRFSQILPPIII